MSAERAPVPCASLEAEMSVLAASLIDWEAAQTVAELLTVDHFNADPRHRPLFSAIARLVARNEKVDSVTITEELKLAGDHQEAGGVAYLAELWDYLPSAANVESHIGRVKRLSLRRRLRDLGHKITESARYEAVEEAELLDQAEKDLLAISEDRPGEGLKPIGDLLWPALASLEKPIEGICTGLADVDDMIVAFEPSDLVIVAGRPSMGKTAFVMNRVALHSVLTQGKACAVFSLEMSCLALTKRLMAAEARVNLTGARKRGSAGIPDDGFPRLAQATGYMNGLPLFIDDTPGVSVGYIRSQCRKLKRQKGLDVVIVDYLQLMSGQGENRNQEVSEISRGLKGLAKELNCVVIALSQLSRKVEERQDKRPMMSDLRESGAIEQDADTILFLYRPEYYYGPIDKDGSSLVGVAEVIVGKQRNGDVGVVRVSFEKDFALFSNFSSRRAS